MLAVVFRLTGTDAQFIKKLLTKYRNYLLQNFLMLLLLIYNVQPNGADPQQQMYR